MRNMIEICCAECGEEVGYYSISSGPLPTILCPACRWGQTKEETKMTKEDVEIKLIEKQIEQIDQAIRVAKAVEQREVAQAKLLEAQAKATR